MLGYVIGQENMRFKIQSVKRKDDNMKKNKCKRILAVALAIVMVAGTIAFTPQGAKEVQAAGTVKDVNLGTAGLANSGSKVYFGLDTSSTITKVNGKDNAETVGSYKKTASNNLWRVLD